MKDEKNSCLEQIGDSMQIKHLFYFQASRQIGHLIIPANYKHTDHLRIITKTSIAILNHTIEKLETSVHNCY